MGSHRIPLGQNRRGQNRRVQNRKGQNRNPKAQAPCCSYAYEYQCWELRRNGGDGSSRQRRQAMLISGLHRFSIGTGRRTMTLYCPTTISMGLLKMVRGSSDTRGAFREYNKQMPVLSCDHCFTVANAASGRKWYPRPIRMTLILRPMIQSKQLDAAVQRRDGRNAAGDDYGDIRYKCEAENDECL